MSGIDHGAYRAAIRQALLSLSVCTTGSTSLSANATGFARAAGSFIADGFKPGMEITATGFSSANNAAKVITAVLAGQLTIDGGCTAQAAANGRTIVCGLPKMRAWTNRKLAIAGVEVATDEPTPGRPYFVEQYIPGAPTQQKTFTSAGEHELLPLYQGQFHVPSNLGADAAEAYVKAMCALFSPGTTIAVGSDTLRVRSDTGPYPGQLMPGRPGFAVQPVTIPFRVRITQPINTL